MSFIFNSANANIINGSLNIFNGLFDLYLVTTVPTISSTKVSDLSLIASSIPILLDNNFTYTIWNFNDTTLPNFTYSVSPIGFVISKRFGINSSNTDLIIYYSELTNSLGQIITYNTGSYRVNINFVTAGLISFDSIYEYFSGAYINSEQVPKGLIYLLGTNNNNTAFSNPNPSKFISTASISGTTANLTDRNLGSDNGTYDYHIAFNFLDKKIRVGVAGISINNVRDSIELWGSNSINLDFTPSGISNNSNWTQIGSIPNMNGGWNFIQSNSSVYWKYIKFFGNSQLNPFEIEFYSSSILSKTLNFT